MKTRFICCILVALGLSVACLASDSLQDQKSESQTNAANGSVAEEEVLEVRFYPILVSFMDRMMSATAAAASPNQSEDEDGGWGWTSFFELFGVTWPDGSSIQYIKTVGKLRICNTVENHDKIAKVLADMNVVPSLIEVTAWLFDVDQTSLDEVGAELVAGKPAGYRFTVDDFVDVSADVLRRQLSSRRDNVLMVAPRTLTRSGSEAVVKNVVEYVYPTRYAVKLEANAVTGRVDSASAGLAVVEPQNFTIREVGTILRVTPTLYDAGLMDLEVDVSYVGRPEWNDYGAEPQAPNGGLYPLPMKQPFFPVMSADMRISVQAGETLLVNALPVQQKAEGSDRARLIFLRARLVNLHGKTLGVSEK